MRVFSYLTPFFNEMIYTNGIYVVGLDYYKKNMHMVYKVSMSYSFTNSSSKAGVFCHKVQTLILDALPAVMITKDELGVDVGVDVLVIAMKTSF